MLRIVRLAEADFNSDGGDYPTNGIAAGGLAQPAWKQKAKIAFSVVFLLVWLDGVASFYVVGSSFNEGSSVATMAQPAPIEDDGQVRYVTARVSAYPISF